MKTDENLMKIANENCEKLFVDFSLTFHWLLFIGFSLVFH